MADVEFKIDENKLWRLVCRQDSTYQVIRSTADATADLANSFSSGFRTGKYHKDHQSPAIGGTQPVYKSNTQRPKGVVPVGIVYTANYAAKQDNHRHNTLLKALR